MNIQDLFKKSRQHHEAQAKQKLADGFKQHTDRERDKAISFLHENGLEIDENGYIDGVEAVTKAQALQQRQATQAQRERLADAMENRRNQTQKDFLGNDLEDEN